MNGIKINQLEIENVKRIKAVKIEPSASGLTIIGGDNNQGKTSVLDAIAWALGGDRYRPSQPVRNGSVIPPNLHIVMDNGLVVERVCQSDGAGSSKIYGSIRERKGANAAADHWSGRSAQSAGK